MAEQCSLCRNRIIHIKPYMSDQACANAVAFTSIDQMEMISQLNCRSLHLVDRAINSTDSVVAKQIYLEEALGCLHQALLELGGVINVSSTGSWTLPISPFLTNTEARNQRLIDRGAIVLPTHRQQQPEYDEGMRYFKTLLPINSETVPSAYPIHQLVAVLLYNFGQIYLLQRQFDAAHSVFVDAYIVAEYTSPIATQILHNLGYIQYRKGDVNSSFETFSAALQHSWPHQEQPNKAHLAATLNCLGVLHFHLQKSDTKKTLGYFSRALSMQQELAGSHSVMVATILNNMGRVHFSQGNLHSALEVYHEALQLRRALLGDNHLDVAATVFNLGQTYHHKGELTLALTQYEEFMRMTEPTLGRHHRDIAYILKCIAQINHQKGNEALAIEMYNEALVSCRAALGIHAEVSSVLNKLGNLYYGQGEHDKALDMYEQGLAVERLVFDEYHPNITVTLSNIAQIHKQCGDLAKAFSLFDEVYAIQLASVGKRDPSVAGTLANMALIHYQRKNYTSALEIYQEALAIRRESFGDDNLEVASTLNSIGLVLFKLGMLSMALESISRSLATRRKLLGDTHRDIAVNLYNIATIQMELGNDDEAMRFYQETLRVEKNALGSYHIDVVQTLSYIAHMHQQRGEIYDALERYLEVLNIQRQNLSDPKDPAIACTLKCIGNLYLLCGDAGGCIEAMSNACRIVNTMEQQSECFMEFPVLGFQLYSLAKLHPEGAAAA
jgi:tetratricopeptide (TPR) repeat protein